MIKLKQIAAITLAMSMAAGLAACTSTGTGSGTDSAQKPAESGNTENTSADLPVLRVAMMPFITSLPTYYILENGLDEAAGFKIDATMFATGAPMNEALAADLWDVGAMGAAAVTGVANYDMMIIGEVLESTDGLSVFVQPDSDIAKVNGHNPSFPEILGDPDTVKGKTILLPVGTAQHFTALKWIEKIGLQPTDVKIVNMDSAQAYQAFRSGQSDAVALNVPTFFEAKNDGMMEAANLAEMGTRYVDMAVANRKALENKSDLVQKYMDCLLAANEALAADPEMAADLMVKYLKENGVETSREDCQSDIARVNWIQQSDWSDRELGRFAKELGEFYIGLGQLEPDLIDKFDSNIVDSYVKK